MFSPSCGIHLIVSVTGRPSSTGPSWVSSQTSAVSGARAATRKHQLASRLPATNSSVPTSAWTPRTAITPANLADPPRPRRARDEGQGTP